MFAHYTEYTECWLANAKGLLHQAVDYKLVLLPIILATIVGLVFDSDYDQMWYKLLRKPKFQPPKWIFPIVWPILYLEIGYALHLLLQNRKPESVIPQLAVFALNLLFNYSWSVVFFGRHQIKNALLISISILATGVGSYYLFNEVSPAAAQHLIPYCVWVLFATMLNYRIWKDNKLPSVKITKKLR